MMENQLIYPLKTRKIHNKNHSFNGLDGQMRINPPFWHPDYWLLKILKKRITEELKIVTDASSSFICCDLGCGSRPYNQLLRESGFKIVAADICGNTIADVAFAPKGDLPFADKVFQMVLSSEVLEHVENPAKYLVECNRVLKNDGYLLMSVPFMYPYHACPSDYWRWTHAGLSKMLVDHSFEIVHLYPIIKGINAIVQLLLASIGTVFGGTMILCCLESRALTPPRLAAGIQSTLTEGG